MTDEAVQVLPKVLDAIGFQSGILMGHSDGATIASIYCGAVEDFRVRGLVVMAPHFFTEPMGLAAISQAKKAYDEGDLKARLGKYHRDVENAFRGWNDSWLNPSFQSWNVADVIDY
ncbi:alpha/beta hydrolase, partial [Pseudomonas fluorescens]